MVERELNHLPCVEQMLLDPAPIESSAHRKGWARPGRCVRRLPTGFQAGRRVPGRGAAGLPVRQKQSSITSARIDYIHDNLLPAPPFTMACSAAASCTTARSCVRPNSAPAAAIRSSARPKHPQLAAASNRWQWRHCSRLPPAQAVAGSGGSGAEEVEYKDSPTDLLFIALCRVAYGRLAGWQSPRR